MNAPDLVVASASPRRRHLLRAFDVPFDVAVADVDETPRPGEGAEPLARRLARDKALAVARRRPGAAVLAADTVVALDVALLGKPADADEARAMLRTLRARAHVVVTGLALALAPRPERELVGDASVGDDGSGTGGASGAVGGNDAVGGGAGSGDEDRLAGSDARGGDGPALVWHGAVETRVEMRAYSDDDLERYVMSGRPLDKAGAYAIQDQEFRPVARIVGCYPNVVGLPLCETRRALATAALLPPLSNVEAASSGPERPDCRLCTLARDLEPPA